jgi:hypothetical protein
MVVAATAVAVAVIGGTAWATMPSETGAGVSPAGDPEIDRSDGADNAVGDGPHPGELVWMTDSGWEVAPGWTVVDRLPNPMGYQPPKQSVGLELESRTERRFALATYVGPCCTSVLSTRAPAGATLEAWLPGAVENTRAADSEPGTAPVHFGTGETLVPNDGVTILHQVPHPDLPPNFATKGQRSAAALIDDRDREMYVLVRELGPEGQVDVVPFTGFDSFRQFLRFANRQYASDEGLR